MAVFLTSKSTIFQPILRNLFKVSACNLNLLEYQSKNLLEEHDIEIQKFVLIDSPKDIEKNLKQFQAKEYVIKAQVLAGGRGKGYFDNGFKSGVHITKDRKAIEKIVENMIGHRLITKQTPKEGILVSKVMVGESVNIIRETYLCILLDRQANGPVIVASPAGGVDIEAVAEKTPELLKVTPIDINKGVTDEIASEVADFLKFSGDLKKQAMKQIKNLYELFVTADCVQLEINPLVETDDNKVICVDAKLNFDDNAAFRQKKLFAQEDTSESDPREIEAAKWNLNYIQLDGNIGCLVNGAGLAMATMDIIKLHGGNPANFLDVGGSVQENQVKAAFDILQQDKNLKAILVNIFGGIVNCATIANGIVNASRGTKLRVPLIVRLEGTNVTAAKKIIAESGLPIISANDLEDAAQKAVQSIS
ncbi:succinate--CoA ligase [GDP-forming] subunit beta, mitochondrial [Chrysoperla carnea]|uniref:succinate--CoA ligase [GDP-forming] subunit beta, mitochondrial n=1 Tax=Chrysoperla carnea TaxID=189513 RepID=UPI001D07CA5A|nr:succinate--CoA ligase [GDP-forming] subunit beta, mitochondrial [Chrysoperla carnea]